MAEQDEDGTTPDRRRLFRDYMGRVNPKADPANALRDGFYVTSPHSTSHHVAARLEIDSASNHLIIGAVGSGKTTELLAIGASLSKVSDIAAHFADVPSLHSLSKPKAGVLVGLAWIRIVEDIEARFPDLVHAHHREVTRANAIVKGYWSDPYEQEPPDDESVRIPGIVNPPPVDSEVTQVLAILGTLASASGTGHVMLFDGIDRAKLSDALVQMLLNDTSLLSEAGVGSVVVGPPELRGDTYREFLDRFATFHFHGAADFTREEGVSFLDGVLRVRALDALLPASARLKLATWSGGILRDLIALARNAGEVAYAQGADEIAAEHVDAAADRFGRALLFGITPEISKRLTELRRAKFQEPSAFVEFTVSTDLDMDLLLRRLVIEFAELPPRFAIHPTIKPLLRGLGKPG